MNKYKSLYKWMIIPLIIMQLGIFMDYWGDFSENAWSVHVHYWAGTAWYMFLVIQPYLVTHGQIERHRTYGMIGLFLAGGVCLSALSMMYRDIESAKSSALDPARFGPFEPWFFYGVIVVEIVMMVAFGFAVIQSILHRKEIENHSWWLVSTVFIIMMPALGRGIGFLWFALNIEQTLQIGSMRSIYVTQVSILLLVIAGAWKFGTLRHPATYLAIAVNVLIFFLEPIGRTPAVQTFLRTVITG